MLVVQMLCRSVRDVELRLVRVRAAVGHRQDASSGVRELLIELVLEGSPPNTLTTLP